MKARLLLTLFYLATVNLPMAWGQTLDPVFNQGMGTDNFVEQVLPLPDGRVMICGHFTTYNEQPAQYIIRLNEDGSPDPSWRQTVNYWVRHMTLQPDGKLVIGGAFSAVEGVPRLRIARLNSDGSLDDSFQVGSGIDEKLTPNDPNPPYVFWMDRQADGKLLITGSFARYNGQIAKGIVRLNSDGSLDSSFKIGSGIDSWGRFVMVQPDQSILLTGWMTSYNGFSCNRMVKIMPDGRADTTYRPFFGDKTSIYSAALMPGGKMIVTGHSKNEQGLFHDHVRLLNTDGSHNSGFNASTDERTESILIQPDGKIIISGWFRNVNKTPRSTLARLYPDGRLDETFVANTDNYVWTTAFDSKGRLLVSGGFTQIKGKMRRGVARLILSNEPSVSPVRLSNPIYASSTGFKLRIATEQGKTYSLQYCDNLKGGSWEEIQSLTGTGNAMELHDPQAARSPFRCYRVRTVH
ncbi:MAG: delta-60 repeat domain-containing protein [Verrucomicrobiales bacterium]